MTSDEMDFIRHSIASHDRQLGELTDKQAETARQIDEMKDAILTTDHNIRVLVETIGKLALIVDNHENRIQGFEGRQQ